VRYYFVDVTHRSAFNLLYEEAWRLEVAAMGNSILPMAFDKLCMVANINSGNKNKREKNLRNG